MSRPWLRARLAKGDQGLIEGIERNALAAERGGQREAADQGRFARAGRADDADTGAALESAAEQRIKRRAAARDEPVARLR